MRTLIASTALAALLAVPAAAQTGTGQFCLKTMAGDAKCNYQTMAQCEQARASGSSDQCVDRTMVGGTTGSGANRPPPAQNAPPADRQIPPPAPQQ